MIKPEINLELSIKALDVYNVNQNIITDMLSNLQEIVNKNCNAPDVRQCALMWWEKQSKHQKKLLCQYYQFSKGLQNKNYHEMKAIEIEEMFVSEKHIA